MASGHSNSGRIPQPFIDGLIARADIVEVIGNRVTLKKAGREYKAVCPFHDEKTPSFTVSPTKGFYHCFGCGAHGTAIGFLMNYENLGFVEAVEALAEMLGLEVPRSGEDRHAGRDEALYAILGEADQIYRNALRQNLGAIDYLKRRGIDGATAGRFAMGYAPDAWDTILKELGSSDARISQLRDAGLVTRNEQGRQYDRFRDRIMFPIRDPRGPFYLGKIGFEGRPQRHGRISPHLLLAVGLHHVFEHKDLPSMLMIPITREHVIREDENDNAAPDGDGETSQVDEGG